MRRADYIEKSVQERDAALEAEGEKLIDEAIDQQWQPQGEVSLTMPGEFSSRVVNRLAERYRLEGGWNVSVAKSTYRETDGNLVITLRKADSQR